MTLTPRIFRAGRLVTKKAANRRGFSVTDHIKVLLARLFLDLDVFKQKIETFDQSSAQGTPRSVQDLITPYCKLILNFADTYKVKPDRAINAEEPEVKELRRNLMQFDIWYTKLQKQLAIPSVLHVIICELNGAVLAFVQDYVIAVSSYPVTTPVPINGTKQDWDSFIKAETALLKGLGVRKVLRNRPKNWVIREVFRGLTTKYQQKHGSNKFMPFKSFSRALEAVNKARGTGAGHELELSEKSYYYFKKDWKDGSFDNVI